MARKKSGGFGKVLEFIGLVDDDEPRDTYEDEYESGNYGRQATYQPQRNARIQQPRTRQEVSRRYSASNYEPTRTPILLPRALRRALPIPRSVPAATIILRALRALTPPNLKLKPRRVPTVRQPRVSAR